MLHSNNVFEEIKQSVSLVYEMEKHGITLLRAGHSRMKCVCPFHPDGDPSLMVYLEGEDGYENFNCFGCDAGGTVIDFIKRTLNANIAGTLKYFSENYSLKLLDGADLRTLIKISHKQRENHTAIQSYILSNSTLVNRFINMSDDPISALMTLKPYLKDIDVAASENDILLFNITNHDLKKLIVDLVERKEKK